MPAERAAVGLRKPQVPRIAGPAGRTVRLKDRILLWPERRPRDVLRFLERQTEQLRPAEEMLFLEPHRRGCHRKRGLDPLVIRQQLPIAERKKVGSVVGVPVGATIVREDSRGGARRVALVMVRGSPHARELNEERTLRELAHPWRLGSVGGSEAEVSTRRIVGVAFEVRPVMLEIGEPRTAFEQQDVETTGGELLRDHGSAAPRTD